jgi:SAM-dependent methyltransferase
MPASSSEPGTADSLAAAELLPELYRAGHDSGWNDGMRGVTHALLDGLALPPGPVLEVGCGGGQLMAELTTRYAGRTVWGVDLHPLALAYAQARLGRHGALGQATLHHLPFAGHCFALLLALDVFDQQGVEMAAALAESRRVLRPGGLLLLRVSAHPWLYGEHDRAFHTGRRYARRELLDALHATGFAVQRMTYINAVLGVPVAGVRLLQQWGVLGWQPGVYASPTANRLLAWTLHSEAHWLRVGDLPMGLSLCVVAVRD